MIHDLVLAFVLISLVVAGRPFASGVACERPVHDKVMIRSHDEMLGVFRVDRVVSEREDAATTHQRRVTVRELALCIGALDIDEHVRKQLPHRWFEMPCRVPVMRLRGISVLWIVLGLAGLLQSRVRFLVVIVVDIDARGPEPVGNVPLEETIILNPDLGFRLEPDFG